MNNVLVGYEGSAEVDISYFYCPYIPGQPIPVDVWDHRAVKRPTDIQRRIMEAVQRPQLY